MMSLRVKCLCWKRFIQIELTQSFEFKVISMVVSKMTSHIAQKRQNVGINAGNVNNNNNNTLYVFV